jgi:hypothetical protein
MANYMADVAKLLGVELGEEFEINKCNGTYVLCYEGMLHTQSGHMVNATFNDLLFGKLAIKRKPWKPKCGDVFWYVDCNGDIKHQQWVSWDCKNFYKIGNCYRYRDEAIINRDRWSRFYASDEVLEV